MSGYWAFFPFVMGIAYFAYFIFAGWICLLNKKIKWYFGTSISLFVVGFLCAFSDLEVHNSYKFEGLGYFFWYLVLSVISSWVAATTNDKKEKKQ